MSAALSQQASYFDRIETEVAQRAADIARLENQLEPLREKQLEAQQLLEEKDVRLVLECIMHKEQVPFGIKFGKNSNQFPRVTKLTKGSPGSEIAGLTAGCRLVAVNGRWLAESAIGPDGLSQ
eukprot:COSAG01_NODE_25859_length_731_cov_0.849684_1_plen_122_part_10